ncbi:MAG: M14 family zinc carboxypeptidase [Phycisphaeraceae bacterium]
MVAPGASAQGVPRWVDRDLDLSAVTPWERELDMLNALSDQRGVDVTEVGQTHEGRTIRGVRFRSADRGCGQKPWTVLLIGLQHGNEPAGREGLLTLISDLAEDLGRLPTNTELWIVPTLNPDGLVVNQRRNAENFDLNRDHLILSQPETRAIHALARRIEPDVIIDCHEFRRDTGDYTAQGYLEWPLVMMDTANTALLPDSYYVLGKLWLERVAPVMASAGINYSRYLVGDAPPGGELRFSTLDPDDARNGMALQSGSLGYIIESGIVRGAAEPQADLGVRARAHRLLVWLAIALPGEMRSEARTRLARAKREPLPNFIPVDTFWGEALPEALGEERQGRTIPVIDVEKGETLIVAAPNHRTTRVVKRRVVTPVGYYIPAEHAEVYGDLAKRHGIPASLVNDRPEKLEILRLVSVSETYDERYHRYAGLQTVAVADDIALEGEADAGLLIDLTGMPPMRARAAIAVFDPHMSAGLYQWQKYRATVGDDGIIPVMRVLAE